MTLCQHLRPTEVLLENEGKGLASNSHLLKLQCWVEIPGALVKMQVLSRVQVSLWEPMQKELIPKSWQPLFEDSFCDFAILLTLALTTVVGHVNRGV